MRWRDLFKVGKDVMSSVGQLTDNKDFRNTIGQAGGFISLISIVYEISEQIHEDLTSDKEKAHNSLSKFVLKTTIDFLKEKDSGRDENSNAKIKERLKEDIYKAYKEINDDKYSLLEWNSNILFEHPVVSNFIRIIKPYIEKSYRIKEPEVRGSHLASIVEYKKILEEKAAKDDNYKKFLDWWKVQRRYIEFVKYLDTIENMKNYHTLSLENKEKTLDKYHVPQRKVGLAKVEEEWTLDDETISKNYAGLEHDVENVIEYYLQKHEPDESYLVIGATYGMGKTSFVRMISSNYARDFLDGSSADYIPVPVFLGLTTEEGDLVTAYDNRSLDYILEHIVSPNEYIISNKILLIFDGLDEYEIVGNHRVSLGSKIRKIREKYQNVSVLITSRLENGILYRQDIDVKQYARLLLFSPQQLDRFFEGYTVKIYDKLLTYNYATELKLPIDEMKKPLFAWIFSFLEFQQQQQIQSKLRLESIQHWSSNMIKSWIYFLLFHEVIKGKYRDTIDSNLRRESYVNEKKILRIFGTQTNIWRRFNVEKG